MKNEERALELQLRELHEFHLAPRPKGPTKMSARDGRKLESTFVNAAARRPRRGRPPAWHSKDERTYQSYEAFVFVTGEMRTLRMRCGKRISVKSRNAFIKFAKRTYPLADEEIVLEHIRKDQGILPHYNEPTCFLLVRFEYEGLGTGEVIVAAPSDKRRCVGSISS
jgi:hypothetical protein